VAYFCQAQIVRRLQIKPRLGITAKKTGQSHGCVCRNGTPFLDDFMQARSGYAKLCSQCIYTEFQGLQVFLPQYFAGMDWAHTICIHNNTSVVINNLNVKRVAAFEPEAQSPLLINSYAPARPAITDEFFQFISRR
jgi:hypothetical protein